MWKNPIIFFVYSWVCGWVKHTTRSFNLNECIKCILSITWHLNYILLTRCLTHSTLIVIAIVFDETLRW